MRFSLFFVFVLAFNFLFAQDDEYGNLIKLYKQCSSDTCRVRAMADISEVIEGEPLDSICTELLALCEKGLQTSKGNPKLTYAYTLQKIRGLENKAFYLMDEGKVLEAMDYYHEGLLIIEGLKNPPLEVLRLNASLQNDLAAAYIRTREFDKALKLFPSFIAFHTKVNDKKILSIDYNNLGTIYSQIQKRDSAIYYIKKSIAIRHELNFPEVQLITPYRSVGNIYSSLDSLDKAELYLKTALDWSVKYNDLRTLSPSYYFYGDLQLKLKKYSVALDCFKNALKYAEKGNVILNYRDAYGGLYEVYKQTNKPKEALNYYILFKSYSDSALSAKLKEESEIKDLQFKHEQEKMLQNAEFDKKISIENERSERRKKIIYYGIVALAICMLLIAVIIWRWRITVKQKQTIELQKKYLDEKQNQLIEYSKVIEAKNKTIQDNISYAYSIQNSLLPHYADFKQSVDASILFLPCDIVSGDFYNHYKKDHKEIFILGDCTGHGVSGAFISLLVIKSLDKIINTVNDIALDSIINSLNSELHQSFRKGNNSLFGVDLVVMQYDTQTQQISFTGSASKFAVLNSMHEFNYFKFKNLEIGKRSYIDSPIEIMNFNKKDVAQIYLFSDGILDQKGGPNHKKYGSGNLEKLILSIHQKESIEQMRMMRETFREWKANHEQMDDVSAWIFNFNTKQHTNQVHEMEQFIAQHLSNYKAGKNIDPTFLYKGEVNYDVMNHHLEELKVFLKDYVADTVLRKRIYSILVEALDNIYRHGYSVDVFDSQKIFGYMFLYFADNHIKLRFGNYITANSATEHQKRMQENTQSNSDELKAKILNQVNQVSFTDSSGAGIGMMDIVRKLNANSSIDIDFEPYNDELVLYSIEINII